MIPECGHPWAPFQGQQLDGSIVCHACVAEIAASRARNGTLRQAFLEKRGRQPVIVTWAGIVVGRARITSEERRPTSISGKRFRVVATLGTRRYYGDGPGVGMSVRLSAARGEP
jgi:hypothetical protein